jgi:cytochrome c553
MTRVEITLGLLAIMATIAFTALIGLREPERMARTSRGWEVRSVESGAQLFDRYCANCHGANASGLNCPPLDELSGLHGGDLGPGVAWRLEELGWDRGQTYEYVYSVISSGRTISTRPDQYKGNRVSPEPPGPGTPTPAATSALPMAMPAWAEEYGGPLRPDQIRDLAMYIAAFRTDFPAAEEPDALSKALKQVAASRPKPAAEAAPSPTVELIPGTAPAAETPAATGATPTP